MRMTTALCTNFRCFLFYRGWTGKLLSQISEETEASHVFLANIDLYVTSFNNCIELRKATATNKGREETNFSPVKSNEEQTLKLVLKTDNTENEQ